jgi:hypothetical protein
MMASLGAMMMLSPATFASLTGIIYVSEVPKVETDIGSGLTMWEPLSFSFSVLPTRVDIQSTAWLWKNYSGVTRANYKVLLNGSVYFSMTQIVPVGKTIVPNSIVTGQIPEAMFNVGENDVEFSMVYTGLLQPGIKKTFIVKAKVYRTIP